MVAKGTWAGRALTGLVALFLLVDGGMKVAGAAPAVEATVALGYPPGTVPVVGALVLLGLALHLVPATAPLGALLLTAFLGGAVSAHVRHQDPLWSHVLFPVYLCTALWAGLLLRRPELGALLRPGARAGASPSP